MSLHAAILSLAGDEETAASFEEPPVKSVTEWSPIQWNRVSVANDDVLLEATPEFHSTDSALPWAYAPYAKAS